MSDHPFCGSLALQRDFFIRATASFIESDASFAPQAGMLSVAAQIAHAAHTVDWFITGAFSPQGFDLDFAAHERAARAVPTLATARALFVAAYARAIAKLEATSRAELMKPIAAGPIMGGVPRIAIIESLGDHTAHHRGALAVYARLCGRVPAMPYA